MGAKLITLLGVLVAAGMTWGLLQSAEPVESVLDRPIEETVEPTPSRDVGLQAPQSRIDSIDGDPLVPPSAYRSLVSSSGGQHNLSVRIVDEEGHPARLFDLALGYTDAEGRRKDEWATPVRGVGLFHVDRTRGTGPILIVATLLERGRPNVYFDPLDSFPGNGVISLSLTRAHSLFSIAGRVLDSAGQPVRGTTVRVIPSGTRFSSNERRTVVGAATGVDGSFEAKGLPAGSYRIVADATTGPSREHTYRSTVAENIQTGTTDLELRVERKAPFRIHAVNHRGGVVRATARLTSTWIDDDGEEQTRTTRWDLGREGCDVYLATQKANAIRKLSISPLNPGASKCAARTIENWRPSSGPIELTRTYPLSGTVIDAAGTPVEQGHIHIGRHRLSLGAQGEFTVSNMVAGTYRAQVRFLGNKDVAQIGGAPAADIFVPQENEPLVLKLDPLPTLRVRMKEGPAARSVNDAVVVVISDRFDKALATVTASQKPTTVYGLDPAQRYNVGAYELPEGAYALARGVRAGDDVVLVPKRGVSLRCTAVYSDVIDDRGGVKGTLALPGKTLKARAFDGQDVVFEGVPHGAWSVTLKEVFGRYKGTARVDTSTHAFIAMAPSLMVSLGSTDGVPPRFARPSPPVHAPATPTQNLPPPMWPLPIPRRR